MCIFAQTIAHKIMQEKLSDCTRNPSCYNNYCTLGSTGISYGIQREDGTYNQHRCFSTQGKLSLFTRDRSGNLTELKDGDYVFNGTYFECKGFALCTDSPPDTNLAWSVIDLLNGGASFFSPDGFFGMYHIFTDNFGSHYHINITCKAGSTGDEITVSTSSFSECSRCT